MSNGKQVISGLMRRSKKIQKIVDGDVREARDKMADTMRRTCPVDTGALRDSIKEEDNCSGDRIKYDISIGVDYADYVEFGTSKQTAQPFIRPAFAEYLGDLERIKGKIKEER